MAKALRKIIPHPSDRSLALVPLTRGLFAVISAVDADFSGQFNWHAAEVMPGKVYAARTDCSGSVPKTTYLHREIGRLLGWPAENDIDHKNGNGLDCARSNIRHGTTAQNLWNSGPRVNNKTGHKNISPHETRGYVIQVRANGLRRFTARRNLEDAIKVAARFRREMHGDRATARVVN